MKLIYKDDEKQLLFENREDEEFLLEFSNIFGEKTDQTYSLEEDWQGLLNDDLLWWGISDSNKVIEKIFDFLNLM